MKTQEEIRAELQRHREWMDENEGGGSSEEGVELGWMEALEWLLGGDSSPDEDQEFYARLFRLAREVKLGMNCRVIIGKDLENSPGRYYFQIECIRMDVITGKVGPGYGGKAYLSPHATDSELIQTIFGLYKGYCEHEARETFEWRGRRPFGPHISTEALWSVARRVDVRSAKHVEDQSHNGRLTVTPSGVNHSSLDVQPAEDFSGAADYDRAMRGSYDGGRLG